MNILLLVKHLNRSSSLIYVVNKLMSVMFPEKVSTLITLKNLLSYQ